MSDKSTSNIMNDLMEEERAFLRVREVTPKQQTVIQAGTKMLASFSGLIGTLDTSDLQIFRDYIIDGMSALVDVELYSREHAGLMQAD